MALQTGALIYWAGTVTQMLKDHGARLHETERTANEASKAIQFFKGQRGMEP